MTFVDKEQLIWEVIIKLNKERQLDKDLRVCKENYFAVQLCNLQVPYN